MTRFSSLAGALLAALSASAAVAGTASSIAVSTGNIESGGNNAPIVLYGSGTDDSFAEYGIATYNFTPADFGLTSVTGVTSVEWNLTQNFRGFSNSGPIEFFFSTDDFDANFTGLTLDSGASPGGVDASQFSSLISLGTAQFNLVADGVVDSFALGFSGAAFDALVGELNAGSDFQLILAAAEEATTATYSGNGNTFVPGDPQLVITAVPEPSAVVCLAAGLACLTGLRRRN